MRRTGVDFGDRVRDLWEQDHARLWRSVLAWSGSTDVASDAVAEAFAQVLRRGDEVRDPAAWVWRTAFRVAAGLLVERRRSAPAFATVPDAVATTTDPAESLALVQALATLDDADRTVVVLALVAGWTAEEIASMDGATAGAVRVRLHRARGRLRDELEVHDG